VTGLAYSQVEAHQMHHMPKESHSSGEDQHMVTSHLECTRLDKLHEYFLQHEKTVLYLSSYPQGLLQLISNHYKALLCIIMFLCSTLLFIV